MKNTTFLFILLLGTAVGLFANGITHETFDKNDIQVDPDSRRVINAKKIVGKINIDGSMDESAWKNVQFQTNFLQREPNENAPATEKTEVGICFDEKNIYFGVKCLDSEPDKIIAREMRRDARIDNDDFFELTLDTYHDQRSGFYFITNPNGLKRDAMFGSEGKQYNPSWDGIWQCRTRITDEGWFIEIAIPWKTLRFSTADSTIWGVNFARQIRRKNEHVFWQPVPRDLGFFGIVRVSEAGDIYGLNNLKTGGNLELKPYFMGGLENDNSTGFKTNNIKDVGLDAKVALTANLALDLTINTDFAQVEADQERVNLTRFSLYFPEKRSFFLEGAEIFAFGGTGGMRSGRHGSSEMNLFYSRRIGIAAGYEARIIGGAKMVGKVGPFQVGVMNMTTSDIKRKFAGKTVSSPGNNFSVIRMRRDVGSRGSLGFMFLNKEEIAASGFNRSFGVDTYLPINRLWSVNGYIAGTIDNDDNKNDLNNNLAAKLGLDFNSDLWRFSLASTDIGSGFNPEMGYIRRRDYRYSNASFGYSPRPVNQKIIRQFNYGLRGSYRTDRQNRMLDSQINATFNMRFQNSSMATIGIQKEQEYMPYNWNIRKGYLIPKGIYRGTDYYFMARSDQSRLISGRLYVNYGSFYTGFNTTVSSGLYIALSNKLRAEFDYRYNYVDLPLGNFHTNTAGLRAFYFFNTELYLKAYVQLNDDKLIYGGQERLVSNLMLRWIYSPGSNIYFVYNDTRMIGADAAEIQNRTAMVKATFFWRK